MLFAQIARRLIDSGEHPSIPSRTRMVVHTEYIKPLLERRDEGRTSKCAFIDSFFLLKVLIVFLYFTVSQQDSVAGHGTYVEYVDSGLYATAAQGQSQM